jgi:hypothetical protein
MSSSRRILESMLSPDSNAIRNNPHDNRTNATRANLSRQIELRNTPTNTSLPHTMTVASPNGTVYQFSSERGGHLDAIIERNLLSALGLDTADNSRCNESGELVYLNPDCYPYFKYHVGNRDNNDNRLSLSTTLAIFTCDMDASPITPEQKIAIDDYCRYNDNTNPITKYLPIVLAPLLFIFAVMVCHRIYSQRKENVVEACVPPTSAAYPSSLSQALLNHDDQGEESQSAYRA